MPGNLFPKYDHDHFLKVSALVAELRTRMEILEKMAGITNWCSQGSMEITSGGKKITVKGHPFDAEDADSEIVSRTKKIKDENGIIRNQAYEVHVCGPCMVANDPFNEHVGEHVDEDKTKALEAWNEGYEAGKAAQ